MCGAGEQCRLAPLVRAGVWMHFRTWDTYEFNIRQSVIENGLTGDVVSEIVNKFGVAARLPQASRTRYAEQILETAQQCAELDLVQKAAGISQFASAMHEQGVTINGVQVSMASKVFWFFSPLRWTMFDRVARVGLGASGYRQYYQCLNNKGFSSLCDEIRVEENCILTSESSPERIIDKILWVLGSGKAGTRCREATENLENRQDLKQLANLICPIICLSPLGQHLLQRLNEMCPAP